MSGLGGAAVVSVLGLAGCGAEGTSPIAPSPLSELERRTASLTARLETAHFVFHFAPGDQVQPERSEAYHEWAVRYLGVTPPKRIDFYKFPDFDALRAAMGQSFGGRAYPDEFALVTAFPWHNHECMHLYVSLIGSPPRLFAEGMVVAHEYDPLNGIWVSQWNRADPPRDPYFGIVRSLKAEGRLYPIQDILESDAFNARVASEPTRIAYPQSGVFVMYLIERHGLDQMKELVRILPYSASRDTIQWRFEETFGVSVGEAETAWLAWLDRP
jgi:hypothetical protein